MPKLTRSDLPVGMDVAQPQREAGDRLVGRELELDDGRAEDFDGVGERLRVERDARCASSSADRRPGPRRGRTGTTGRPACRRRAASRPGARPACRLRGAGPPRSRNRRSGAAALRRPRRLADPAAGQRLVMAAPARTLSVIQARSIGSSIRRCRRPSASGPTSAAPPAGSRSAARLGEMRIGMRPRADQALARHAQSLEQARDGVGIAVGPAADGVDGALDRGVVLAHRAVPPVGVAPLVAQPELEEQRHVLQPLAATSPASARRPARGRADGTSSEKRNDAQPNSAPAARRPCNARRRR